MKVELNKTYWRSITLNSQVNLTDQSALDASAAEGRGMQGMEYTVKEILSITEKDKLCEWLIFKLVHPKQTLYLVVKIVDDNIDLRVFYNPDSIIVGDRNDQLNAQNYFMFANHNPKGKNNLLGLKYTQQIAWTFDYGNGSQEVIFNQKGNMELTGTASYQPRRHAGETLIATISEYLAASDTPEPEIMIVEVGNVKSKTGGAILLLVGNSINEFEMSIVRK